MAKKQHTLYQRLNYLFSPSGQQELEAASNNYNIGNDVILKTKDKGEYETAKLQAQQQKYLGQMWKKIDGEMFQQSMHHEVTRIGSYSDFESMEFYPEISAALDTFMEESTTPNDKGKVLNIYSESKRVKRVLEDLFFNRLDLHTNLPMWTRNLPIKYDSVIPLLNGEDITIKELSKKLKENPNKDIWTYSVQDDTKKIVPGKITWCDLTRKNSNIYRITLDDGRYVETTPDHEFMLRNGSFKKAEDLMVNDSLMPFYTKISKNEKVSGYEKIYNPNSHYYKFTHGMVAHELIRDLDYENSVDGKFVTHHIDLNNFNNEPNNYNHKVIKIELLSELSDVYCMEVVGPNGENDRHNFPICGKNSDGTYERNGVFVSNCKYGDDFVYINTDDKAGVTGCRQMPNYEMERREGDIFNALTATRDMLTSNNDDKPKNSVKFYWKGKDVAFNSWQIAHFRLLGDDRKLPYGTSILEKARRIWKQCVHEDTRVWTKEGYKKIKEIHDNDILLSYDYNNNSIVETGVVDCWETGIKKTYNLKSRYNDIRVTDDHPILVFNGGEYTYKTINEIKIGSDYIVTPTNKNGEKFITNKVNPENYYIKLNNEGLKNSKKIDRNGIMAKLKMISEKEYKNIHRFLQGKGKIKYKYIDDLKSHFKFTLNDIDVFYGNTKTSMVNKDLSFTADKDFYNFFGFMLGDGWLTKNGVGFALGIYDDVNNRYIDYVKEKFKNKIRINQSKHSEFSKSVNIDSTELKSIFEAFGFISGFKNKEIPSWVFSLDLEGKREFIKGLFEADGSDKYGVIGLANKKLITDLKELCNQAGIASGKISTKPSSIKYNELTEKYEVREESYKLYINFNNLVSGVRHEKVLSYDYVGEEPVWDLMTESELHNFVGNGVVVHNCLLSEDAMLVYRVTRAPERRIYKVYVGNVDDQDVEPYVNEIANRFKRRQVIDPQTGQIDLRYNQLAQDQDFFIPVRDENSPTPIDTLPGACIALDTRIPLLDGRTLELNEIINEWDNGNRNLWVYSCDPETGKIAPGQITWAGETRKNAGVIKITLDNGEEIITTPDHKWVHRTKGFVEAQDLIEGDSLMPFYRRNQKITSNTNDYEQVWDNEKQEWVFTHRMVTDFMGDNIETLVYDEKYINEEKNIRHHLNYDRFNNRPSNLVWMNGGDHRKLHQNVIKETIWFNPEENKGKISKGLKNYINNLSEEEKQIRYNKNINNPKSKIKTTEKLLEWNQNNNNLKEKGKLISKAKSTKQFKEKFSIIAKKQWENGVYRNKVFSKKQELIFTDKLYNMFFEMFKKYGKADLTLEQLNNSKQFLTEFIKPNENIRSSLTNLNEFTRNHLDKMLKQRGFNNYREWCKITAEELGYKNVRAWRYYIAKDNEVFYNHKIAKIEWLDERQDTGTITVDGNEKYHNYHTFACESGVYIKNSNLSEIADIEYLQRKLFTALRVPKTFLGFEEAVGEGKNLALQDIRFSRTINRIQQAIIMELNKIAIIHLYVLGFTDDLDNFVITLNNPSTQAEMLKIEHMQSKINLYNEAVRDSGNGFGAMSMTKAKRDILGWSDDEIKQDLLEQRIEKAASAELEKTAKIIKHTGLFDKVDNIYGDPDADIEDETDEGGDGAGGGSAGGGFAGGSPDFGGEGEEEELDFGEEGMPEGGEEGAPEGGEEDMDFGEEGGEEISPEEIGPEESIKRTENILTEEKRALQKKLDRRKKKYRLNYLQKLTDSIHPKNDILDGNIKIYDKGLKVNENINNMIGDIDDLLKENE